MWKLLDVRRFSMQPSDLCRGNSFQPLKDGHLTRDVSELSELLKPVPVRSGTLC